MRPEPELELIEGEDGNVLPFRSPLYTDADLQRALQTDPEIQYWPRLTRFYGLSFSELLSMERWQRKLYIDQMGTLVAEEQLHRLEAAAYPHSKHPDRIHKNWVEQIDDGEEPGVDPRSAADMGALADIGIKVVKS